MCSYRVHNRQSSRWSKWDYSRPGWYFITIDTSRREHFLGRIRNGVMGLSASGCIVSYFWQQIPKKFGGVYLDEFIVMPNHVHGIIDLADVAGSGEAAMNCGRTEVGLKRGGVTGLDNPMLYKRHLGKIIRWFKGRCTYEIRKRDIRFGWHVRYYDCIIRNRRELQRVRRYIRDNPLRWQEEMDRRGYTREPIVQYITVQPSLHRMAAIYRGPRC